MVQGGGHQRPSSWSPTPTTLTTRTSCLPSVSLPCATLQCAHPPLALAFSPPSPRAWAATPPHHLIRCQSQSQTARAHHPSQYRPPASLTQPPARCRTATAQLSCRDRPTPLGSFLLPMPRTSRPRSPRPQVAAASSSGDRRSHHRSPSDTAVPIQVPQRTTPQSPRCTSTQILHHSATCRSRLTVLHSQLCRGCQQERARHPPRHTLPRTTSRLPTTPPHLCRPRPLSRRPARRPVGLTRPRASTP